MNRGCSGPHQVIHNAGFSRREGIEVVYRPEEVPTNLPKGVALCVYRIAQEAMHNTVKHAHARHVALRLEQTPDGVMMEVGDDGVGFVTTASFPGHLGLHSMRERVANLGGTFQIESTPGVGTRICVRIPGRV